MTTHPGIEFRDIWLFFCNIISVIRMSLGDFYLDAIKYMDNLSIIIFWLAWICIVLMTLSIHAHFLVLPHLLLLFEHFILFFNFSIIKVSLLLFFLVLLEP